MFKLIERKIEQVNVEKAKWYLEFNTYKNQRQVRPAHVKALSEKIESGFFRTGEIAFAALNGDREVLLNGQHQICAVLQSGLPITALVEHYKCDTRLDVSALSRQFENLSRSLNDHISVERSALGLDAFMPNWVCASIVAAEAIRFSGKNSLTSFSMVPGVKTVKSSLTLDKRISVLKDYVGEKGRFMVKVLADGNNTENKSGRLLRRAPIAYVVLETYFVDAEKAVDFWRGVQTGEFLAKDSPQKKLHDFLLQATVKRTYGRKTITNHEFVYRAALAWNAWRKGKSTNLAYRENVQPPKLV